MENISIVLPMAMISSLCQRIKKSFCALVSLVLICLLAYNSAVIFHTHIPFPANLSSPETIAVSSRKIFSETRSLKLSSDVLYSVKADSAGGGKLKTHLPLLHKNRNLVIRTNRTSIRTNRTSIRPSELRSEDGVKHFEDRVKEFWKPNSSDSYCKFHFFMTWISSLESFGDRQLFAIESLFKVHPNDCLIIVSDSLDSRNGMQILRPFTSKGFKVTAISPDFNHLFKNTPAQNWYSQLVQGNVNPGEVSLGQNLSNLLRLGLLYMFGGVYVDTDIIVLRSFRELRNAIGAQTIDVDTGNWSRLNNAVMIFDQGHPLLYKFIEEFALTFDGNKWGHNGPYLVSRVVSRINGRPGYKFTVLPPMAFYPVDWSRIGGFFEGPMSLSHSKWLVAKLRQLRSQSYTVHLWNKQSKGYKIEKGSILDHLMIGSCLFCSNSTIAVV